MSSTFLSTGQPYAPCRTCAACCKDETPKKFGARPLLASRGSRRIHCIALDLEGATPRNLGLFLLFNFAVCTVLREHAEADNGEEMKV